MIQQWQGLVPPPFVRGWFDGGCRNGVMGGGVVLQVADHLTSESLPAWQSVISLGFRLGTNGSSDLAELAAAGMMLCVVFDFFEFNHVVLDPYCYTIPKSDCALTCRLALDRLLLAWSCSDLRTLKR